MANEIVQDQDFKVVRSTVTGREGWYWQGLGEYAGYALPLSHGGWLASGHAAQHASEVRSGAGNTREQFTIAAHQQRLTEGTHFTVTQSNKPARTGWRWVGLGSYHDYAMPWGCESWATKAEAIQDARQAIAKLDYSYQAEEFVE
ncbi:MAG: hypothetical protein AAFY72_18055 [Cyanobacteria bacterium J06649_4]